MLAARPKSAHPGAKKALAEIWGAEDKAHAQAAVKAFEAAYGANSQSRDQPVDRCGQVPWWRSIPPRR